MAIGDRIKRARTDAGLSQRELADRVKVTHGLVGQWESHRKKPGRENLRKIAEATLTDADALLREGDGAPASAAAAQVSVSPEELSMLRRFRLLKERQRKNLLELLGVSADVAREQKHQTEPAER